MTHPTMTHPTITHLTWIRDALPLVEETKYKGTPRHWNQSRPHPHLAEHLADLTLNRTNTTPINPTPAPLYIDILDLLEDIHRRITTIWATIRTPGTMLTSASSDAYLTAIINTITNDPTTCDAILPDVLALSAALEPPLGWTSPDIHLKATCPHCHATNLLVRATPAGPLILCDSGVCNPSTDLVRTWYYGQPAWHIDEWEHLAQTLNTPTN